MASIYETKRGQWVVQWDAGKKRSGARLRPSQSFDSYEEAVHFKVEIERRRIGTGTDDLATRGLEWVESRRAVENLSDNTANGYADKLAWWGRLLGNTPYKKLTTKDLDFAFARLAAGETPSKRTPTPRTLHHYRRVLITFFNAMVLKGEIAYNPALGVEKAGGLEDGKTRAPTVPELKRYLEVADASKAIYGQLGTIIRLSTHLGLRRGEICGLRWSDVDFDAMKVHIRQAATQPRKKPVSIKGTKTKASRRTIGMVEPTAALLRAQRQRVAEWRLALGKNWADNDLVFCDPLGQLLNLEKITRRAGEARDRAGLPRTVQPLHSGRHYNLSQMAKAGVELVTMKERAGHTDIRTTSGYCTVDDEQDRRAAEAIRGALL